jgi:hypothetical protein
MSSTADNSNPKPQFVPNLNTFYDKVYYNTLHWRKKKGTNNEFGIEIEPIIPSNGEVRLLGNRNN